MVTPITVDEIMDNQKEYKFTTDKFDYANVEVKGDKEKNAYVTGYISVPEIDLYNDVVTMRAMQSMLQQINDSTITIDYEHEAWRDDNSILPVAKIIEAKVDDRGLWVKAVLNKSSPKYKDLWGSIKGGFINAFSIAFKPLMVVEKDVEGTSVRVIEELKLLNVAFTGSPVNQGAKMTSYSMKSVMLKAIDEMGMDEQVTVSKKLLTKLMEEKSMEEEQKKEEIIEEVIEEKSEAVEEEIVEEKSEAVEEAVEEKEVVEEKSVDYDSIIAEMKSMIKTQTEANAKLAAEVKALNDTAVFKSPTPKQVEVKATPEKDVSILGLC